MALVLILVLALSLVGCGKNTSLAGEDWTYVTFSMAGISIDTDALDLANMEYPTFSATEDRFTLSAVGQSLQGTWEDLGDYQYAFHVDGDDTPVSGTVTIDQNKKQTLTIRHEGEIGFTFVFERAKK